MRRVKKGLAAVLSLMLCISVFFVNAQAADKWEIENKLDLEQCSQGGTLLLSVTLKGESASASQKISSVSGVLEYDNSLFTVETADILPAGKDAKDCKFDPAEGKFSFKYDSDLTVKNTEPLLQIRLHTAADASVGKTTVCVTNMQWSSADGKQKAEIEHRIPAHITILEPELIGDVNGDGEVDLADARMVMQHYNGAAVLDSSQQKKADVNGDGKINLTDIKLIMQYYNGEIDEF